MPLLKRKAFEKSSASGYLRDYDEVFHCEITDEIFKDYEEYCERIILVNSMVWSCEMTGKNNLTYAEALESEKAARRSLRDFPMELRVPILYLASLTKRCSFAEMSEDVFNFVRERFFVGETVEACLEGDNWKEAHVLSVTSQKQQPGSKSIPPPSAHAYEVEQYEEADAAASQIGTAPPDRLRRRKGVYSRDKNRLFLKQFVQQGAGGIICIKNQALEKYNINKTQFEQIFTGSPPQFESSKKLMKASISPTKNGKPGSATKAKPKKHTPDKKGQQSMDKFVKRTDKNETPKTKSDPAAKKSAQELAEKMRKAEELMKQKKEEEKARKKETAAKQQAYLKEWQRIKDDQELEDHKAIPVGTPVDIEGIPQHLIGDFFSLLEFVYIYADILKTKDVFHNDLDIETLRKALVQQEHAGVFCDLIQMFLTTIFTLQEDEAEDYNESGGIEESTEVNGVEEIGVTKAVELATKASKWSQTYLGTPLSKLPLDPTTVSEVLRLHLLSSGSAAGSRCATWRYHQRGGYSSPDDPGLRLRVCRPQLLADLALAHVAQLQPEDKFVIMQCLMNQILSYATVRDVIEEKLDELKNTKQALRLLQINERKREAQIVVTRQEIKKEFAAKKEEQKLTGEKAKALEEELRVAFEKVAKKSEEEKHEFEKKQKELQIQIFDHASYLGSDRGLRRYWVFQLVAGVFVEAGAEPRGQCRAPPRPDHDKASSDKENDSAANSRNNSPKKPLAPLNGINHKVAGAGVDSVQQHRELMLCTGDIATCYVHGKGDRPQWWVYHTEEHIEALIQSLNKRGLRENDLRNSLVTDKRNILEYIKKCPLHSLNPAACPPPAACPATRGRRAPGSQLGAPGRALPEALELALRDHILEFEEKIFHGCLGALKVKDREAWRGTIMLRGYDKQADYLSWGPNKQYRDDYHLPNGVINVPEGMESPQKASIPSNKYRDPGHWLLRPSPTVPQAVRDLSRALLQLAEGIHHKYLKRPLGLDEKERKDREAKNKPLEFDALERWEVSLMESLNFSSIVLHLLTLDSSVTWSASILNASCRLCRRKTDPDNMLLCDSCNKGHHLYCLKPKLTKVPEGDWFCDQCRPKEKTPRKKRKLFSDEDIEEAINSDEEQSLSEVCGVCGSGGELAARCYSCGGRHHAECSGGRRWCCPACEHPDEDSEDDTALVNLKTKKSRASKESSPVLNGSARRGRRKKEESTKKEENTKNGRKSKNSLTNGVHTHEERSTKRSSRHEAKLHEDLLQTLLIDIEKHKDSWPFHEPVSLDEVPDYLEVIGTPMDFGTMRQRLTSKQYSIDAEFMEDAALVLTNCFTYNKDTHPVARAGVRLERYINKRTTELGLPPLPEIILEHEEVPAKRHSSEEPADAPKPKKQKTK